jgi:hypothetical protein
MCNKYIEQFNSTDLTIGPKMFSTLPIDVNSNNNQRLYWLVDLWNNSIAPLLIDVVKEGILVYGTKDLFNWEDPKQWILKTLPLSNNDSKLINSLISIESNQVGYFQNYDESSNSPKSSSSSSNLNDFNQFDEPISSSSHSQFNNSNRLSNLSSEINYEQGNEYLISTNKLNPITRSNDNDKLLNMLIKLQEVTLINNQQRQSVSSYNGSSTSTNDSQNSLIKLHKP